METKANYVIVGLFTVLAVLAAFGFVYWTSGIGERGETALLRFRIPGSASGLDRGSAVLFNGVKVGGVVSVYLDLPNSSVAIADAEVERNTPVTASTSASVGLAGLTGQANIELTGGDPSEPNLLNLAEQEEKVATLTATPSPVTNLLQKAQSLLTQADSAVGQLEGIVSDVRDPLSQTIRNVENFTGALASNSEGIESFLANMSDLSETVSGVSDRLDSTLSSVEGLINSVDRQQVAQIVQNVDRATQSFADASGQIDGVVANVEEAVNSLNAFSQGANSSLAKVDALIDEVDPQSVGEAVQNFEQASAAMDQASTDIARLSETISSREEDINGIITDASQLGERLNQASVRVDRILTRLDEMLNSGDSGESLVAEARATLESFREVAETLNARVGTITDNLSRFSGQGLRDLEALATDARRSINRIEQAVTDFEQNPQRIITGGEGEVRRYDGRPRR